MNVAFSFENSRIDLEISALVVAVWPGRNMAAVQHPIDELAAIGIPPPSQFPLYYRVSQPLLPHPAPTTFLVPAPPLAVKP